MFHLTQSQWLIGAAAALFVGISKTGVPGTGIIVVPLLAYVFGGRPSVGYMLPMLILGDCFAVFWYRRHAQWDKLVRLLPWVVVGMVFATAALQITGQYDTKVHILGTERDILDVMIGVLVLVMLVLHLLRGRFGEALAPTSKAGTAAAGAAAGFATTISNAAGPIMQIYLSAQKLPKKEFMGTIAWYFFIINSAKVPIYIALSMKYPDKPIMTMNSFWFLVYMAPAILVGVFIGKWLLPRISQRVFDTVVLVLAAVYALKLVGLDFTLVINPLIRMIAK